MALGRNGNIDGKLIILQARLKDADGNKTKPYFSISDKVDGSWVQRSETTDRFSGTLKKFLVKTKDVYRDGKVVDKMNLLDVYVEDGDETYLASFTFKISTRGLMNRLLNLTSPENVQISLWQDDKGYEVLTLRQNDQVVKAKYSKEEVPSPPEVKIRGSLVRDYFEVDQFFIDKINSFSFAKSEPVEVKNGAVKSTPKEELSKKTTALTDIPEDDIPF
jgi:hypothetical protein